MISENFIQSPYFSSLYDYISTTPIMFVSCLLGYIYLYNPSLSPAAVPFFLLHCLCILFLHIFLFILPLFLPVLHGPAGQVWAQSIIQFSCRMGSSWGGIGPNPGSWVPSWLTLYQNPDGGYQHKIKFKTEIKLFHF